MMERTTAGPLQTLSMSMEISGGETITLDQLQSFIDHAKQIGIPTDKALPTAIKAPFHYDQRDHSPGSFTITATL